LDSGESGWPLPLSTVGLTGTLLPLLRMKDYLGSDDSVQTGGRRRLAQSTTLDLAATMTVGGKTPAIIGVSCCCDGPTVLQAMQQGKPLQRSSPGEVQLLTEVPCLRRCLHPTCR
jgi:hypothetical protein